MKVKEISTENKKVRIDRSKNNSGGYEYDYYLMVFTKDTFGNLLINYNYKHKDIHSLAEAEKIAKSFLIN